MRMEKKYNLLDMILQKHEEHSSDWEKDHPVGSRNMKIQQSDYDTYGRSDLLKEARELDPRNDHFSGNVLSPLFFRFLLPGRLHLQKQWSFLFHPHSRYGPGHLFFYQIPSPYFLPCFPFFSKSPFLPRSPVSTTNRDTVCRL